MPVITNFITKEWFKTLGFSLLVLFLLITVADLLNGFLMGKDATRVLLEYSFKLPDLMSKVFPVCSLLATLFTINRLKSNSELIAIFAGGFSYRRFFQLVILSSLVPLSLQFINLGFIEPSINRVKRKEITKSQKNEGKYIARSYLESGRLWYKSRDYFASFSFYDSEKKRLQDFQIFYFTPDHLGRKMIHSDYAKYLSGSTWELRNSKVFSSLEKIVFPIVTKENRLKVQLEEKPEDFGDFESDLTTMNVISMARFINGLEKTGLNLNEYKVLLYNKLILSLVCIIFALLPMGEVFKPNRRTGSFGKNVVFTLIVTVCFWVLYSMAIELGNSGTLPPLIAVSLVPLAFFTYIFLSYRRNRSLYV